MDSSMNEPVPCAERSRFSEAVATAINKLYWAKAEHDRAIKEKRDAKPYAFLLTRARIDERHAVKALEQHRKQHGC
jgi:hypothetical protein